MSLLVTNARLITVPEGTDDPGYIERGWLLAGDDGRIAGVGAGDPPVGTTADETLDVDGKFVAPGFISSHSHLFTSGARGLGAQHTLYGWYDSMFSVLNKQSPELIYWSTLHGSLDFLSNGITTAYNFADTMVESEPMVDGKRSGIGTLRTLDFHTRQADGCADAGIRFVDAIGLEVSHGTDEEIFARWDHCVEHLKGLDPDFALAPSIMGQMQWALREDAAEFEVEVMRRYGVTNQAHFLETYEQHEYQQSRFSAYRDSGALRPGMIFGHFIQTTPEIIEEAAAGGASMSWQPTSNGRLASGIAHVPEMLELGMKVGIGLDDQSCTDVSDPWQNMRIGMYLQRARTHDPESMMPERVLRLHTLGGAEIMGVADKVGSLEVGKFADFLVVDPTTPDIGHLWAPVRNYVMSCTPRNLKQVYVGGKLVDSEGVSTNPLAAEASARMHEDLVAAVGDGWIL